MHVYIHVHQRVIVKFKAICVERSSVPKPPYGRISHSLFVPFQENEAESIAHRKI